MTRMALLTNAPTIIEQSIVTSLISTQQATWWHWFPTVWLIDDPHHRDPTVWTTIIRTALPQFVFLLISLDDPNRAPIGFMRPDWYEWIRQRWPQ